MRCLFASSYPDDAGQPNPVLLHGRLAGSMGYGVLPPPCPNVVSLAAPGAAIVFKWPGLLLAAALFPPALTLGSHWTAFLVALGPLSTHHRLALNRSQAAETTNR
jgi:hypothetical protein